MPIQKFTESMWMKNQSGLFLPNGTQSQLSETSSQTYLAIKEKAVKVESIFDTGGVPIPSTCDLNRLITSAKELSDSWLTRRPEDIPMLLLFQTAHFDRIAEAVLPLESICKNSSFLKKLTSGNLDFFDRKRSHAKDILWELELWALLQNKNFKASLEEPDIIIEFEGAVIGIPCKKIYSPKNTPKVLSKAVKQAEKRYTCGIVALNIDDTLPPKKIIKTPTFDSLGEYTNSINVKFIKNNERHFRRYLSKGRLISAMVSTSILADTYEEKTRFNNSRQSTIWAIPSLSPEKSTQLNNFHNQLMCRYPYQSVAS